MQDVKFLGLWLFRGGDMAVLWLSCTVGAFLDAASSEGGVKYLYYFASLGWDMQICVCNVFHVLDWFGKRPMGYTQHYPRDAKQWGRKHHGVHANQGPTMLTVKVTKV